MPSRASTRETRAVPSDVPRSTVWKARVIFFGGLAVGAALLGLAATQDDPPVALWIVGGLVTAFFGYHVATAVVFRLRYRTPEEREAARERLIMGPDGHAREAAWGLLAKQATRYAAEVLRTGHAATAVVAFAADGRHDDGGRTLVYLELDVSAHGARPRRVRTGDYVSPATKAALAPGATLEVKVDPAHPDRVAVDWARTLPALPPTASSSAGTVPLTIIA